jgi:hypothetical protein
MTLAPAIILIIVAAIVGYVLGIIDSRITATLRKKIENDAPAASDAPQTPAQATRAGVNSDENNRLGEHTILRVSIDQTLKLHLELDKAQVDDPNALSAEQRQRLINLMVQIRPWIDGTASQSITAAEPEPILIKTTPSPISPPIPVQTPVASTAPKIDALRGLRSMLKNEIKTPGQDKGISIVMMIDDVLQAKLMGSTLLSKSIRLEEGSMGEVIVLVGANRYNRVDEVPDPEIRAMIKSAISDWEKK